MKRQSFHLKGPHDGHSLHLKYNITEVQSRNLKCTLEGLSLQKDHNFYDLIFLCLNLDFTAKLNDPCSLLCLITLPFTPPQLTLNQIDASLQLLQNSRGRESKFQFTLRYVLKDILMRPPSLICKLYVTKKKPTPPLDYNVL